MPRKWWATAVLWSLLVAIALSGCPVAAQSPDPAPTVGSQAAAVQKLTPVIHLEPTSGYAGTFVNVRGTGWPPSTMVAIKLEDAQGRSPVVTASTTDASGEFSIGFLYPIGDRWLQPGALRVVATIEGEEMEAAAQFMVKPPEGVQPPPPPYPNPTLTKPSNGTATPPASAATLTPTPAAMLPSTPTPTIQSTPGPTMTITSSLPSEGPLPTLAGGSNRIDLVWNSTETANRLTVGLAATNGAFLVLPSQEFGGFDGQAYQVMTADVNGDGFADLVWNLKNADRNRFVISRSNGNGTFDIPSIQEHRGRIWQGFKTLVGDVNGDGRDDLIWNETNEAHNRIYVGLSTDERRWFALLDYQEHRGRIWQGFKTLVGDVNGDGRDDLIWNETNEAHNRIYVGLSNGNGVFILPDYQEHRGRLWQGFQTLIGDVNSDGLDDLIWNETREEHNRTYVGLSRGDGTFDLLPYQERAEPGWLGYRPFVGDVNGDGRTDLIWNQVAEASNRFAVGLSVGDGTFDFRPLAEHIASDWAGYQTMVGDVNGDGRTDLIWNRVSHELNQIAVALSRGDGFFQLLPNQEVEGESWSQVRTLPAYVD